MDDRLAGHAIRVKATESRLLQSELQSLNSRLRSAKKLLIVRFFSRILESFEGQNSWLCAEESLKIRKKLQKQTTG